MPKLTASRKRWLKFYTHDMKPLYFLIIADLLLLLLFIKFIFGNTSTFIKAFLGHVFSDFDDLETFKKWDKEHDIHHKINLLYAVILGILILSFVTFTYLF